MCLDCFSRLPGNSIDFNKFVKKTLEENVIAGIKYLKKCMDLLYCNRAIKSCEFSRNN